MTAPPPLPPSGGAPPPKKSNVLLWVLAGIGGFIVLCVVALMGLGLFVAHKVKQARTDGSGLVFSSGNGSVRIGGRAKLPAWVPDYPGSNPQAAFSASGKDGEGGTFVFQTGDSPDKVHQYYESEFQSAGMRVSSVNPARMLVAQDDSNRHSITVMIGEKAAQTSVTVTYGTNR